MGVYHGNMVTCNLTEIWEFITGIFSFILDVYKCCILKLEAASLS